MILHLRNERIFTEPLCLPSNCRLKSNTTDCLTTDLEKEIKLEDQTCEKCQDGRTKLRPVIVQKEVCNNTKIETVCREEREISWSKNCTVPSSTRNEYVERFLYQRNTPTRINKIQESKIVRMKVPLNGLSSRKENSRIFFEFSQQTTPKPTNTIPRNEYPQQPRSYVDRRRLLFEKTAPESIDDGSGMRRQNSRFLRRPTPASLTTPATTAKAQEYYTYHSGTVPKNKIGSGHPSSQNTSISSLRQKIKKGSEEKFEALADNDRNIPSSLNSPNELIARKDTFLAQNEEVTLGNAGEMQNKTLSGEYRKSSMQELRLGSQNAGRNQGEETSETFAESKVNENGEINICGNFEESKDVIKCKLMACFKDINYCFS